jgi:hypothetical protein
LPRNRKPVTVSIHSFFTHPFGRDYRQDVLRSSSAQDVLFVDKNPSPKLIRASEVRGMLNSKLEEDQVSAKGLAHGLLQGRRIHGKSSKLERDAEFSREMMMLPLAIKNPDVPFIGSRSRYPRSLNDVDSRAAGPER